MEFQSTSKFIDTVCNRWGTDIQVVHYEVDERYQLRQKAKKLLCKVCRSQAFETLLQKRESGLSIENIQGQPCLCQFLIDLNRRRYETHGQPMSHSQVCIAMQEVLRIQKFSDGSILQELMGNKRQ